LKTNISHITEQHQPYCAVKWVILHDDMADIANCDEENGKVKRWKTACKKRIIEFGGRSFLLLISISWHSEVLKLAYIFLQNKFPFIYGKILK